MTISSLLKTPELFRQQCFINNQWQNAKDNSSIEIHNPATGEIIGTVPNMGKSETTEAIHFAAKALPSWREKIAKERAFIMRRWFDLITEHTDDLATILTLEQGKPLKEAQGEIKYGAAFIEWFGEEAKRIYGDVLAAPIQYQHLITIKQPIGVVGAITPWNFPCAMITRKCAPALAAGCTVVLKPSSLTPFTALALAALAQQAGFPEGVLNILTGKAQEIGTELATNPVIRKLSFTGSTAVGKSLMQQASGTIKKVSLELGGNAPFIVFDDADLDAAVKGAIACKFRNTGQTCVCANRILVQDNIYDIFAEKLTRAVKALKVGNGLDQNSDQGPLINQAAIKKVEEHIKDAISKGAKIIYGGKPDKLGGTFFEPTVLTEITDQMLISQEETFGPVAPLFRFKTDADAIALANNTPFGLASYFYSQNIYRIWRIAEQLEYGMVGINAGIISSEIIPFGGVKESGIGREGSKYGIEEYIEIKSLCMGAP